ncbi:MAG TPA: ATP-binding protein, partial [Acetobacteraceae bacterium]|nr:ATP-binding protein [Acetobacteraceae bacterium]
MTDRPTDSAAIACVAHDVNNLLSAIMAAADAALARPGDPACRADLLQIRTNAQRGAARLWRLLSDDPAAAHHSTSELRPIDPTIEAIADTLRYVAGSDIRLEITYGAPEQLVLLNADDLHDALLNLTTNARDAMSGQGSLTLRTSVETMPAPPNSPPDSPPLGRYVLIELRDSGPGVVPALHQQIFEPFFTTKQPGHGTGLGLYSVRKTAQQHGGFVTLSGAPGGGTAVRLYLPVTQEKPLGGNGRLVLLVEDEPALRRLTTRALTGHGWRVIAAEDGEALLTALSHDLDSEDRPAVLISDMTLPGLDGPAVVRAVRQTWPELPVVLISGYAGTNLPAGLDRATFLRKPFGIAELARQVSGIAEPEITQAGMAESDGFMYCSRSLPPN